MKRKQARYPADFKLKVVAEAREGTSVRELAQKYKVHQSVIYGWMRSKIKPEKNPPTPAQFAYKDTLTYLKHAKAWINESLKTGVLREMDQSHLLMLLALQTLEGRS